MNRRGKREVEIRTVGLGGKISVSLPMKSSRQLGTNPKATTCVYLKTHNALAFGHLSIHYDAHTQTVQRTSPWDCRLKMCCTQQLWIALTKSTMETHSTQANLCGEQENGRVRMHSAFHMSTNLHPSESISGRYIWTCLCGLMLTYAYVFALAHSSCLPADATVFFCTCGHTGMEHGRSATELSSEKRFWARPAVQYLESVFMRGTTTANSITALWLMFICFAPYRSNFQSRSSFMSQNKKVSVKIFTPRPDQSFINPAERACSGFHHKDVTLKLTTTIIIRPYFSYEFV